MLDFVARVNDETTTGPLLLYLNNFRERTYYMLTYDILERAVHSDIMDCMPPYLEKKGTIAHFLIC
jgi:hypothetical protein